jgi:2-polyprenyl-6-hydroxyphenyl methylase/3-demethylubiquinone-9 3-methyltransferase
MTASDDPFVRYYASESLKDATLERFAATKSAVMRAARHFGLAPGAWNVADIGCGAATQCALWARDGHRVHGADINEKLIQLGRERAAAAGLDISLTAASATQLPWPDESMDVCLCPELLEHVADWQSVLREAIRVLRPGGTLYLSTTNTLCPVQEEFDLPGYSWYPAPLKRRYERLSVTTRPELVNHAKYPAVNWFTYFQQRRYLKKFGLTAIDRFDVAGLAQHSAPARLVLTAVRSIPPLRWLAHVATPYTMVFARKASS